MFVKVCIHYFVEFVVVEGNTAPVCSANFSSGISPRSCAFESNDQTLPDTTGSVALATILPSANIQRLKNCDPTFAHSASSPVLPGEISQMVG